MDEKIINPFEGSINNIPKHKVVLGTKNRVIRPEYIICDGIFNVPIFNGMNDVIGRAILTRHLRFNAEGNGKGTEEAIVLTDIVIYKEEDRRNGAADDVMKFLTEGSGFTCILTGGSTPAGKKLCLKHGFKVEVHGNEKCLVWRKVKTEKIL